MSASIVWLVNGWSNRSHSIDGKGNRDVWATRCGLKIQSKVGDHVEEYGVLISDGLLNQEKIELCRKCFGAPVEGEGK